MPRIGGYGPAPMLVKLVSQVLILSWDAANLFLFNFVQVSSRILILFFGRLSFRYPPKVSTTYCK